MLWSLVVNLLLQIVCMVYTWSVLRRLSVEFSRPCLWLLAAHVFLLSRRLHSLLWSLSQDSPAHWLLANLLLPAGVTIALFGCVATLARAVSRYASRKGNGLEDLRILTERIFGR